MNDRFCLKVIIHSYSGLKRKKEKKIHILSELNPFEHYYDSYLHKVMKPNAWSSF